MAVLPPIAATSQTDISKSTQGNDVAPTLVIDPNDPLKMVSVWTHDDPANPVNGVTTYVQGAYSTDGGAHWSSLGGISNFTQDFSQNNGADFSQVTDGGVAFGPAHQFYVLSSPHTANYSAGDVVIQKFDFSGGSPTSSNLGASMSSSNELYRWTGDAAYKPTLAVDANQSNFADTYQNGTSPPVGYTQADKFVGNIYVAWGANLSPNGPANPNVIEMSASSDGGATFTQPEILNDTDRGGIDRDSTPKLVISQGHPADPATGAPAVVGGQVTAIWDNSGGLTPGDGAIVSNRVQDGAKAAVVSTTNFGSPGANGPNGGTAVLQTTPPGPPTQTGNGIAVAVNPGSSQPHEPEVTTFPLNVALPSGFGSITDIAATISLIYPNLSDLKIELVAPGGVSSITLLDNKTDATGTTNGNATYGATGANLGLAADGVALGTTFADNAGPSAGGLVGGNSSVGRFRSEEGTLSSLVPAGSDVSRADGTWMLRITSYRADSTPANLINFSLSFTSGLHRGSDSTVAAAAQAGSVNNAPYAAATADPRQGIGPGAVIASDNSLGAYSPFQGRLYVAYVNGNRVFLKTSDDGGATWQKGNGGSAVDDANPQTDGYTGGGRPQFLPSVAVDQSTGTVVLSFFDTRDDASQARVATYVTTSIDGGQSFSKEVFVNTPTTATDEISGNTVTLGPIPDNQSAAGRRRRGLRVRRPPGPGRRLRQGLPRLGQQPQRRAGRAGRAPDGEHPGGAGHHRRRAQDRRQHPGSRRPDGHPGQCHRHGQHPGGRRRDPRGQRLPGHLRPPRRPVVVHGRRRPDLLHQRQRGRPGPDLRDQGHADLGPLQRATDTPSST